MAQNTPRAVTLPKYSQRRFYPTVMLDGIEQLDFVNFQWDRFPDFLDGQYVAYHRVQEQDIGMLDKLAMQYYGDDTLWWVLALANGIADPYGGFSVNDTLKIPTVSQIETFYQTIQQSRRVGQRGTLPRRPI